MNKEMSFERDDAYNNKNTNENDPHILSSKELGQESTH